MNSIEVLLFASLKERAGVSSITLELPDDARVQDLKLLLAEMYPSLAPALDSALVSLNKEFAFDDDLIPISAEAALFPPVSGGSDFPTIFRITEEALDLDDLVAQITLPTTGAACVFTGMVRGLTSRENPHETIYLEYEAYRPMAEAKMKQVAEEIRSRWSSVEGIAIVQRIGRLDPGTPTVLIACTAAHRDTGVFEAARFGIDRLKEIVPVWKKRLDPMGTAGLKGITSPIPRIDFLMGEWICTNCKQSFPDEGVPYRCPTCGGVYDFATPISFDPDQVSPMGLVDQGIWRYRHTFKLPDTAPNVYLGEGTTPLVWGDAFGRMVAFKLETLNPTGSYKDRGSAVLVSFLLARNVREAVEDSSGNAGASFAAYAAKAGIRSRIYIPDYAAGPKRIQIELAGAEVIRILGPRSNAADAVRRTAEQGSVYASHAYLPQGLAGYATIAYELVEQMETPPATILVPAGQGNLLLAIGRGFQALQSAGVIQQIPHLIGVQARACAPLWAVFNYGMAGYGWVTEGETLAEGVRIKNPVRGDAVMQIVADSQGQFVVVDEEEILAGRDYLSRQGLYVEPTAAIVWSALRQVADDAPDPIAVVLTGSGLKSAKA